MARNYPGFFAAFFIILLRIGIGWHFLNEGVEKYESSLHGREGFSAEVYLRNANGPLGPYFRQMIPDVDSRDLLDQTKLKASWQAEVARIAEHFQFTEAQRTQAAKLADDSERWADYWFSSPENAEKRQKYFHDLDQIEKTEQDPDSMSFQRERAWESRRSVESDRRALIAPLVDQGKTLRDAVVKLATSDQLTSSGEIERQMTQLDLINITTTYGIMVIGVCLILGLMTPLAALSAAAFLAMIYLSMPPWPGLPPNPKTEGHYFIVSKNLVELLACLVIASTPSGHWVGLDAVFFGAQRRRRLAPPPSTPNASPTSEPVSQLPPSRKLDEDYSKPIPIG